MSPKKENYNLLEEDWIPVLWSNGNCSRVGIRTALTEAGRIRQIAASNPMDRLAILRFLLALLYWCGGNPPNEKSEISSGPFPSHWFSKLDKNRDCFNLLGDKKRFYQDRRAQRSRASTDLIQEIPTGNNFWHFRHSTDKRDGLCLACCVMGLLRLPLFSVSGLPDLKAGINGTPPIYVAPWNTSLLKTLYANWMTRKQLGDPAWIQPDIRPASGEEVPVLVGLTLLSRRVWLHDLSGPSGRCSGCGAKERRLIRTCEFQTAGKQENDLWSDSHVVYLDGEPRKSLKAPDLTSAGKFRMDRPWPDLFARIVDTCKHTTSLLIVGLATDQAKNIDVWERTLGKPSTGSIQETATSMIQQWQKEGFSLARRIRPRNEKATSRKHVEIPPALNAIRPHVEYIVSETAAKLVGGSAEAWEQAASEYRPMMAVVARSLSPGYSTAAVQRRKQIAGVAPDMRPKPASTKKTGRIKKGDKK